ncbi:MAG: LysM peptidoglycan-binding domain-containing protein [Gammaproteobacteria bacterium]|nr:LysM peptidoglycan-binding domain-containing protein [Gammaproteobacteria bacterium]
MLPEPLDLPPAASSAADEQDEGEDEIVAQDEQEEYIAPIEDTVATASEQLQIPDYWEVLPATPDDEHQPPNAEDLAPGLSTQIETPPLVLQIAQLPVPRITPFIGAPVSEEADDSREYLVLNQFDLWMRIRRGFRLQHIEVNARTQAEINWFASHNSYLDRTIERAQPYLHYIVEEAEKRGIPAEIALLPIVESAFQPFAYSHGRAAGIWQFIPSTGKLYGLKQNWWYDGRRDITESTRAALDLLQDLERSLDGDWLLALAAYNSGLGTVSRAIRKNQRKKLPTDFWSLKLPRETRSYAPKLLAISAIINNPTSFGIRLKGIADKPVLTAVDTGSQIDLALAADLADIPLQEMYRYNPAFNRWATDPDGPHQLLVPLENAETFRQNLAALPAENRLRWERHQVRNGETLIQIAEQFNTTVELLKKVNQLSKGKLHAGQTLTIPVASRELDSYTLSATQRLKAIQNRPASGKRIFYTVRNGDTLWSIARQHRVDYAALAKWNGMAPRDPLKSGQTLAIWIKKKSTARDSIDGHLLTALNTSPDDAMQKIRYKVRRGDSLHRISQKFNVKVSQLRRWNALPKSGGLRAGQVITLFVDVTQQSGSL